MAIGRLQAELDKGEPVDEIDDTFLTAIQSLGGE
jgi:hypothetical protein